MQTQVTFRHFKGQHPNLHAAAEQLAENFMKFNDKITNTKVEFINDNEKIVEFVVHVQGSVLSAKEASDDFHKSLNAAADKMIRQLQKHKKSKSIQKSKLSEINSFYDDSFDDDIND